MYNGLRVWAHSESLNTLNIRAMEPFVWLLQVSRYKFVRESINGSAVNLGLRDSVGFSQIRSQMVRGEYLRQP